MRHWELFFNTLTLQMKIMNGERHLTVVDRDCYFQLHYAYQDILQGCTLTVVLGSNQQEVEKHVDQSRFAAETKLSHYGCVRATTREVDQSQGSV